ncbi:MULTISPECIES: inositol monophosphatase family protein [Candidatus Ichthyocystis]|uniref:Inositol-1-monophosphatase n=1 Tax=Candidatus Ichthyocystis hellenicum TaxID=1561003 RepID=A0A0S4M217_9BURK|nr:MULTISPECIES: inositol monophosphatase family protein [Ichthyocystis]CUT17815.1 Inositol-1-monophosphatase [Candidatus Ichthyocystis hellenicum]
MHHYLSTAIKAVRQASSIIIRDSIDKNQIKIKKKEDGTFSTNTDVNAERCIVSMIHNIYPEHDIYSEECGWAYKRNSNSVWYIDPIDGTNNFIHGIPHYAISIGLIERGIVTHGVVYDPNLNEMFTASRGVGAFLNDRRIRVSTCSNISQAHVNICTQKPQKDGDNLTVIQALNSRINSFRVMGSSSLALSYVATGRFDAFFGEKLKTFDIAAGSLLVTEAGGIVSELFPQKNITYLESGDVLASSPKLVTMFIKIMKENINSLDS